MLDEKGRILNGLSLLKNHAGAALGIYEKRQTGFIIHLAAKQNHGQTLAILILVDAHVSGLKGPGFGCKDGVKLFGALLVFLALKKENSVVGFVKLVVEAILG